MLLSINLENSSAERIRGYSLSEFGIDERKFQHILFKSLDRLVSDNELLLLMESRRGPEEPDLMALDKNGNLYIFELKAVGSNSENLLQVLRYGQLFGGYKYEELARLYKKHQRGENSLAEDHQKIFDVELKEEDFNRKQIFVIMTNGIDFKTREAIKYWRSTGLDVRAWVYRAYKDEQEKMLLEITSFSVEDNPFEDLSEGYYILNTNYNNDPKDHEDMLNNKKAAAYFEPWKFKMERLSKGDAVFLYQSKVGIIAYGNASDKLTKASYQGKKEYEYEEYSRKLNNFRILKEPISASEVKEITGTNYIFMQTMFGIDQDDAKKIIAVAEKRLA